jgi:hypothetical protein
LKFNSKTTKKIDLLSKYVAIETIAKKKMKIIKRDAILSAAKQLFLFITHGSLLYTCG